MISGNILGVSIPPVLSHCICEFLWNCKANYSEQWIDWRSVSLRLRARSSFAVIATLQGAWWIWITVNVSRYHRTHPTFDWVDSGFGTAFGPYILLTVSFQMNYLFLYFIIHHLAVDEKEIIRYAALLRGTESAWQAVSYGLTSLTLFAEVGGVYFNFSLWAVSLVPVWFLIRHFGAGDGSQAGQTDGFASETPTEKKQLNAEEPVSAKDI